TRELVLDLKRTLRSSSDGIVQEHRPGKVRARRRGAIWAIAAAVAGIVGGGLWFFWERDYFWRNPLADAKIERVTDFDGDEVDATISPDGKFMSFVSDRDGRFDVWVSQIGSGEFANITKGGFRDIEPAPIRKLAFSGNGAQVWFVQGYGAG